MHQDQSAVIPQKLYVSLTFRSISQRCSLYAPQENLLWFIKREGWTLTFQVLYTNKQGQALFLCPGKGIEI